MRAQAFMLQNNIRLVLTPMGGTEAVTIMVMAKAGSRAETRETNGLAHFLEHVFFKGGLRYPTAEATLKAADMLGAETNAYTSSEEVAYYIQCAASQTAQAMDILSDMILNACFDPAELEKERGVVLEEINRMLDDPGSQIWADWARLIFGDQPLGRPILGPPENIKRFSRQDILDYRNRFYANENMVISVAGKVPGNIIELAESYFGEKKITQKNQWELFDYTVPSQGNLVNLRRQETNQAHFIVGTEAPHRRNPLYQATQLLSIILGSGMSSRLFLSVREKQGLCYEVCNEYKAYADAGDFCAYAGVTLDKIDRAIASILHEYGKIADEGATAEELLKAKNMLEGRLALRLEDSGAVARFFGKQELLYNTLETPDEIVGKAKAITLDDIKTAAQLLFDQKFFPPPLRIAVIGPYDSPERFQELLRY